MLKDNPSAGGWLRRVARNLCLNHLTRYRARWTLFSDFFHREDDGAAEELIPHLTCEPEAVEPSIDHEHVQQALLGLPAKQRVPLVLFHYEEMSYEEIATFLKTSLSQVKTDIHRGREALRDKIVRLRRQSDSGLPNLAGASIGAGLAPISDTGRTGLPASHQLVGRTKPTLGILQMLKP